MTACLHFVGDAPDHTIALLLVEHVGNVAAVQHIVQVNKHVHADDLRVGDDEAVGVTLQARLSVKLLNVRTEISNPIVARHQDLIRVLAIDESGKLRQRLLSASTDADQHRVASWVAGDTRDTANVFDRILEKHEVHAREGLVVLTEALRDVLESAIDIRLIVNVLLAVFGGCEGRPEVRLLVGFLHYRSIESQLRSRFGDQAIVLRDVINVHHPITESSGALVHPQARE
mmetsp:Transcript_3795/g.12024  ORF Transcript_3795/g.12024 Transcript_3795/m.12024 type:complete len:230 (+) Transcript_3795:5104-5793(+)